MKYTLAKALAIGTVAAASAGAQAALTYGDIVTPAGLTAGTIFMGDGNVNGNWTISTDNNIEVALVVKVIF